SNLENKNLTEKVQRFIKEANFTIYLYTKSIAYGDLGAKREFNALDNIIQVLNSQAKKVNIRDRANVGQNITFKQIEQIKEVDEKHDCNGALRELIKYYLVSVTNLNSKNLSSLLYHALISIKENLSNGYQSFFEEKIKEFIARPQLGLR